MDTCCHQLKLWYRHLLSLCALAVVILVAMGVAGTGSAFAQTSSPDKNVSDWEKLRLVYVPFSELPAVLNAPQERVLLSREEIVRLLGNRAPEKVLTPNLVAWRSAQYQIELDGQVGTLKGKLVVESLAQQAIPVELPWQNLIVQTLQVDGKPPLVFRDEQGKWYWLILKPGTYELELDAQFVVTIDGERQSLSFRLPEVAASALSVSVPGNVDVLSGPAVLKREFSDPENVTQLELAAGSGAIELLLTLNNRYRTNQLLWTCRQLLLVEIKPESDRFEMVWEPRVMQGQLREIRAPIPSDLEIVNVSGESVKQWQLVQESGNRLLTIQLHDNTQAAPIQLSGLRTRQQPIGRDVYDWRSPVLNAEGAAYQPRVILIQADPDLWLSAPQTVEQFAVDLPVAAAIVNRYAAIFPEIKDLNRAEKHRIALFSVADLPELQVPVRKSPTVISAVATHICEITESRWLMTSAWQLENSGDAKFQFELELPARVRVLKIRDELGELPYRMIASTNPAQIQVDLREGLSVLRPVRIIVETEYIPENWFGEWSELSDSFQPPRLLGTDEERGVVAIGMESRFSLNSVSAVEMRPLGRDDLKTYRLEQLSPVVAYEFENRRPQVDLVFGRKTPQRVVESITFIRFEPTHRAVHGELLIDVRNVAAKQFAVELPADAPETASFSCEPGNEIVERKRRDDSATVTWDVTLGREVLGNFKLYVDYEIPVTTDSLSEVQLTPIKLANADLQTTVAAVEGSADIEVAVPSSLMRLPIDELQNTTYQPGRYLVGLFDLTNQVTAPQLSSQLRQMESIPTAVVEVAENRAIIGGDGQIQVHSNWRLKTTFPKLLLELPADCELWSLEVNGEPQTAKQVATGVVISFSEGDGGISQNVRFAYSSQPADKANSANHILAAPRLRIPAEEGVTAGDVPVLRFIWKIQTPAGYRAIEPKKHWSVADEQGLHETWWQRQKGWMLWGINRGAGLLSTTFLGSQLLPRFEKGSVSSQALDRNEMPSVTLGGQSSSPIPQRIDDELGRLDGDDAKKDKVDGQLEPAPPLTAPQEVAFEQGRNTPSTPPQVGKPTSGRPSMSMGVQGYRSLAIATDAGPTTTFEGLGLKSGIEVTLVNQRLSDALAAVLVVCIVLLSLCLTNVSLSAKLGWLIFLLLLSLIGVWVQPVVPEIGNVLEKLIWVPVLLIVLHVVRSVILSIFRGVGRLFVSNGPFRRVFARASVLLVLVVTNRGLSHAQEDSQNVDEHGYLKPVPPIVVDDRVVLIPYDPQQKEISGEQQWLFSKRWYDELRAQETPVHEIKMNLPEELILPSTNWSAVVQGDRSVRFTTNVELTLPDDQWRRIPLDVENGVFVSASINGEPVALLPARTDSKQANDQAPGGGQMQLLVRGPEPQQISLVIEYAIVKSPGGWRVDGRLPSSAATQVGLSTGELVGSLDWRSEALHLRREVTPDNQFPSMGVHDGGKFRLTYQSPAMQTDLSRQNSARWQHQIFIRPTQTHWLASVEVNMKEASPGFSLELPPSAMIEKIECNNLKSWTRSSTTENQIDIELLSAANREQLNLELSLPAIEKFGPEGWLVQMPQIAGFAEASGILEIYRSSQLTLSAADLVSIYREDFPTDSKTPGVWSTWQNELEQAIEFQRFRFDRKNASVRIVGERMASSWKTRHMTILSAELAKTEFESRIVITPDGYASHDLAFTTPAGLVIEDLIVTPAEGQPARGITYQIDKSMLADGQQRWHLRFTERQSQAFALVLRGKLPTVVETTIAWEPVAFENSSSQRYEYALGSSPALTVEVLEAEEIEYRLPAEMTTWLQAARVPATQKAWVSETAQHRLKIRAQRLPAEVVFDSITDVTITARAIEQTVLLEWMITRAGIEQVEFVLPEVWSEAKLDGPWISRVTREPFENDQIKFTVYLQDRILGEYRLALSLDQSLSTDNQRASLPINLTGTTRDRWLTVQNSGRFEVDVQPGEGLESVNRQRARFRELEAKLGAVFVTQAYAATRTEGTAQIAWNTLPRTSISTVTAGVRFSVTELMLDRSGYYLAKQNLMITNRTEQILELELPAGAKLLNLRVDSQPARPLRVANAMANVVSIPLIKSSELNLDYAIAVMYEGVIDDFDMLREMDLPLAMTRNIETEVSHVHLHLPAELRALQFLGTMTQVDNPNELSQEFQSYQQQILHGIHDSINLRGGIGFSRSELDRLEDFVASNSFGKSAIDSSRMVPGEYASVITIDQPQALVEELKELQSFYSQNLKGKDSDFQDKNLGNRLQLQSRVAQQFNKNEDASEQNGRPNFQVVDNEFDGSSGEADKKPAAGQPQLLGKGQSAALGFNKNSFSDRMQLGQQQGQQSARFDEVESLQRDQLKVDLALVDQNEKLIAEFNQSRSKRAEQGEIALVDPMPKKELADELNIIEPDRRPQGNGRADLNGDESRSGGAGGGGFSPFRGRDTEGPVQPRGLDSATESEQIKSEEAEVAQDSTSASVRHAGLFIDITPSGQTFYFRVPKGKPQLSAQFVEQSQYHQLWSTAQIAIGIAVVAVLALISRKRISKRRT